MAEALTPEQLSRLKAQLESLRADLEALLAEGDATKAVELDQSRQGRLSRMDAMQQQAMAVAAHETHRQQLRQVLRALKRMEEDDYGYCRECDEPIAYKRLTVRPEAELCLQCQSNKDQTLR
ncbi:TraR/DksA family transcriptional regulator [Marinimicrobium locisalis]|uniref:TraR/DksA family transcriptional regulator n=1 Tax=Marinimicrobium locisalis TaxID=546022 RepID=UPI003221464F